MYLIEPLLFGAALALGVYAIIKANHNNSKVIKKLTIIGLSIAMILAMILLFFLILALV